MITPYYKSLDRNFTLIKGDCIELLNQFEFKFDMIFADPPYHLSNNGFSIQSGKKVSVNKGVWDKSQGYEKDYLFDTAMRFSLSHILGLVYLPCGTLNSPFEFTRYNPLKQVLFKKINNAASSIFEHFLELNSLRFSKK